MPRDDDFDSGEGKWESKYDDGDGEEGKSAAGEGEAAAEEEEEEEWALPGMGQAEEETLLIRAMKFTNSEDFKGEMDRFVASNVAAWESAADVRGTGEGSSHEELAVWRTVHEEFLELFEALMEAFVRRDGSDLTQLMEDCREAMANKYGWLFEDENHAGFVGWMKSVLDFEHFHGMMCDAAKANLESRVRHK